MYLDFYGLNTEPFAVTPDPEFLFLSECHKEALASLMYGVNQRKGFMVLVGEVGTGKTTVLRSFLNCLDQETTTIHYIFNANLSFYGLLLYLLDKERIAGSPYAISDLIKELQQKLIQDYRAGRTVVFIVDEAQHMPVKTLERLRLLSNLETTKDKLLQIVLVGQPELDTKLHLHELRQLRQRIAVRAVLRPLSFAESMEYIQHRLQTAKSDELVTYRPIFTQAALKLLAKQSQGYPRVLNILCDNALITGLGYHQRFISKRIVNEVIQHYGRSERPLIVFGKLSKWQFALLFIILGIGLSSLYGLLMLSANDSNAGLSFAQSKASDSLSPDLPASMVLLPLPATTASELVLDKWTSRAAHKAPHKQQVQVEKIVQAGDTMSGLITEVYGYYSLDLLQRIEEYNPHIQPIDVIRSGDKIVFPAIKQGKVTND